MSAARLLALLPLVSSAASAGAQLPATRATFTGRGPVTVPFQEIHQLIVIPVTINGHGPLRMILDTGAPVILIPDTRVAARLNLTIVGRAQVGGAGDGTPVTAPLATGITARVGGLEVSDASGVVGIAADVIPGVDGVIGGALLRHAAVEIDWDRRTVTFHDPSSGTLTATGDTLPLRVAPSLHSYTQGTVRIGAAERPLELHLDTGSRQALSVSREAVDRYPAPPDSAIPTIVGFGSRGPARGHVIRSQSLTLGGATLRGIVTTVPDQEPGGEARVGLPVLRRFHVVVDYPATRLILRPRPSVTDSFPFSTTGIVLAPGKDSTRRVVADLMAGSPAVAAGLAVGDTLVAVDGVETTRLTEDAIDRSVLKPAPATTVRLRVMRGGQPVEASLTSRMLLPS